LGNKAQPDVFGAGKPEEPGPRPDRSGAGSSGAGSDRKFRLALVLYGILGLLVWFTVGTGSVLVQGKPVQLRLVPLIIIGGLALRTVVAHQADKIRRQGENGSSNS
jgi:hypothetical protein